MSIVDTRLQKQYNLFSTQNMKCLFSRRRIKYVCWISYTIYRRIIKRKLYTIKKILRQLKNWINRYEQTMKREDQRKEREFFQSIHGESTTCEIEQKG